MAYTWNDPSTGERLTQWANESLRLLRPSANERIYANFQTYEANSRAAAVYGVNLSRLADIKQKYDRENFFRRNSNISPAQKAESSSHT
jgi:hypothetical protein